MTIQEDRRTELVAGNIVARGEHVGRVGNTGRSTAPHKHTDVHRNYNPTEGTNRPSFDHTIDIRAFYAEGFASPWSSLIVQP